MVTMNRLIYLILICNLVLSACSNEGNTSLEDRPTITIEEHSGIPTETPQVTRQFSTEGLDGESLVRINCLKCHDISRIEKTERTEEEWGKLIDRMKTLGAAVKPDEKDILVEYLSYSYGP